VSVNDIDNSEGHNADPILSRMISNERPSPFGHRSHAHSHHSHPGPKPNVVEETLKTDKIQIERKTFVFTLKENPRGRFLRITEDVNGRRDTIIIPAPGLADFKRLFEEMLKTSNEIPSKVPAGSGD
jgi:hypothetical protein